MSTKSAIHFKCPTCGAEHRRGFVNGVDVFRCLKCGYDGYGFHSDPDIDLELYAEHLQNNDFNRAHGIPDTRGAARRGPDEWARVMSDSKRQARGSIERMKSTRSACLLVVLLSSCRGCPPAGGADGSVDAGSASSAAVVNRTDAGTTVYASFGTNSQVTGWPFCADAGSGNCSFPLGPGATQALPTGGLPANVTLAFDQAPSCGVTVAEFNFNVSGWSQDTANISLVNGWNHDMEIDVSGNQTLGPTQGAYSNVGVYGVYPYGCDVCVFRQSPPCGIPACGSSPNDGGQGCGCQLGGQYNPVVPCQESFARGAAVTVALVR